VRTTPNQRKKETSGKSSREMILNLKLDLLNL
jgi:hypothetical protein